MQYFRRTRSRLLACLLLVAGTVLVQAQPAHANNPNFKFPAAWYNNQSGYAQNWDQSYGCTDYPPEVGDYRFTCNYTAPNGYALVHEGVDIPFPNSGCNTYPVYAGMSGTIYIGNDVPYHVYHDGFGPNYPILQTDVLPSVFVVIGHTYQMYSGIQNGQHVTAGQQIAWVGTLGNSTGCHVHFEVDQNACVTSCSPPTANQPTTSIQPYAYLNGFISPRNDVFTLGSNPTIGRSIYLASPGGTAYLSTTVYPANGQYTWTDVISSAYNSGFDYVGRSILQNPMYIAYDPQGYTWTSTISWVCCTGNVYTHQTQLCAKSNGTGCAYLPASPQSVYFQLPAYFYWQGQLANQPNSPPCRTCQRPNIVMTSASSPTATSRRGLWGT